jgi:hypothetical protein
MWLTGRLMPDFKTIANFRKDNGRAIRSVCRQFIVLCRQLNLFTEAIGAIDGSKFKAVNNRDKNFTRAKMQRRLEQIEESVARYLHQMDSADRQEPSLADQDDPPQREDREAEGGDAAPQDARGADARDTGPADFAHRSRFPIDGHERPGLRRRRV